MEVLVYYFGQDRNGYYQYPTDYTEDFFRQNLAQARNKVQIAIHRDGNLLFYNYIRCLDELGSKIGIGFATDFILLDYQNLFETFANFYVRLVEDGAIVQLTSNGQIIIKPQPFANEKTYLDEFAKSIEEFIKNIPGYQKRKLPTQNYSISKDDCRELSLEAGNTAIATALENYCNLYLTTTDHEIERITSFSSQIREKTERINQLEKENEKIRRQKKQYRLVLFMALVLMGCVVGLIVFNNNVESLRSELESEKMTTTTLLSDIDVKNNAISDLNQTVSQQKTEISELNTKVSELNSTLDNLKNSLSKLPPLLITDLKMGIVNYDGDIVVPYGSTIYSSSTMYLSPQITYYGTRSESLVLKTKLFLPSGTLSYNSSVSPSGFTNKTEIYTLEGKNDRRLTGWGANTKGNWSSGDYRIEIWYDTTCLYSKTFKIY